MSGHIVQCLVGEHPKAADYDAQFPNGRIQRLNLRMRDRAPFSLQSGLRYRAIYKLVKKVARQSTCEQMHAARPLSEGLICYFISKRLKIPYVCYVHGEDISVAQTSRQLRLATSKVLNSASLLICNSDFTKQMLLNDWKIPTTSIAVINPGVDTNYFVPTETDQATRAELGWNDRPVILTVGRLQRRKGQDNFIRSLTYTKQKLPNVLYAIVGDGPYKEDLRALVRQHELQESVLFHGEVSDETIKHCYQQCDLFALPNRTDGADVEGFGMVSMEAQSCQKPALVGNSGGTPETVLDGETGVVVDCTNPELISEQTVRLLCDREILASMGQKARHRVVEQFDWKSIMETSSQIFDQVTN